MATLPVASVSHDLCVSDGQRYLYVVFSCTPYKIGRFIRVMTHNRYNHVSISLDPELKQLYSFARYYRDIPFYAGFVRESGARYSHHDRVANIKICALPVTEEQYRVAKQKLDTMRHTVDRYHYNLLSAIVTPLHCRIRIPNAYTCVEFVMDFLTSVGACPGLDPKGTYAIREFERIIAPYEIYRGQFPHSIRHPHDVFERHPDLITAAALTVVANAKLLGALIRCKL